MNRESSPDSSSISEQLRSVEDREAMLVGLLETAPIPLQVFRADGHSLLVNPALVKTYGKGPPPEYNVLEDEILARQGALEQIGRAFAGETVALPPAWYDIKELRGFDTSGVTSGRVGIQATLLPLFDRDRVVRHVVVWGKDVTSELELRLREERQRLTFAAARVTEFDINLTRNTLYLSDNACELLGLRADAPIQTLDEFLPLVHPEDRDKAAALERERDFSNASGPTDHRFRLRRPDNAAVVWLERRSQVWRDDVTGDVWRRGILMDITDREARETALRDSEEALRRTEDQLRQAQKLEAIGRLAGGIAHDFNNLLSVILSYSQILRHEPQLSARSPEGLDAIRDASEKAAKLTRQLLAVSRQQVVAPRVLDFNDTVQSTLQMLRRLLGEDIDLVIRSSSEGGRIHADAGQLEQVVLNLAINARDAMPAGGKLVIETTNVVLDEQSAADHPDASPGPHVVLAVSDTGVGMDKDTRDRIFEPFFTTKPVGKGTGLGLATVLGIVRQSHGHISVQSEPGVGTTFRVYFPRVEAETETPPEPRPLATLHGEETVLLVEDQDEVRAVARDILRLYGYRVVDAPSASEALSICEHHAGPIHLLLTDVVMPHMNGRELAERALQLRPQMRVLFMSGYTEDAILQQGVRDSSFAYLQKPLVPDGLARRVREVLEQPSTT